MKGVESLSTWRFRLSLQRSLEHQDTSEQGAAFRAVRKACGLDILDCAEGWRVAGSTLDDLERGRMSFPSAGHFQAALSQLWLWGAERKVVP
jgi:hypothetical protein